MANPKGEAVTEPSTTTWEMKPHTRVKHKILEGYLQAWFPILLSWNKRVVYVDAFAGPGEYENGEDGSPIVALKAAADHRYQRSISREGAELVFYFIECDRARYANLCKCLDGMAVPSGFRIVRKCGEFKSVFGEVLDDIDSRGARLAPAMVFIDPFGVTGFPCRLVRRLSEHPQSEVLINFNIQAINQWLLDNPRTHGSLDALFGSGQWRSCLKANNREHCLHDAYQQVLKNLGWRVRSFRMVNSLGQTQYYLFFASHNWHGLLAMKQAMWSVSPSGTFVFSDRWQTQQGNMFDGFFDNQYSEDLARQLGERRRGMTVPKKLLVQEDLAQHPVCISRHLTRALRMLEYEASPPLIIDVIPEPNKSRKRRLYPDGCRIRFAP